MRRRKDREEEKGQDDDNKHQEKTATSNILKAFPMYKLSMAEIFSFQIF